MRRLWKIIPSAIFFHLTALIMTGCSGGMGTMDGIMHSWDGAPLDAVIAQWGYPNQEQTIGGHKLYHWYYTKSASIPATTTGTVTAVGNTAFINATTSGGGIVQGACTRTMEVDERNTVIRWQWSGNNCPFAEAFEYSSWRRK
jgi:hypothetical protein